jgi:very-short-patch-repair endonuclease
MKEEFLMYLMELFLLNILNQIYPKQWKFTGNGKIWINYQNPDFIHKKHKKVIELFGEYWHEKKEQRQRINKFKKEGYDCLVIWHDKDKLWKEPENVVNKIISWNQS